MDHGTRVLSLAVQRLAVMFLTLRMHESSASTYVCTHSVSDLPPGSNHLPPASTESYLLILTGHSTYCSICH